MLGFGALAEVALAEDPQEELPLTNLDIDQRYGRIVAQTSATPLVPMTRKRFDQIMAAEARGRAGYQAIPTLIKLRMDQDRFSAERDELTDFSNHA